MAVLSIKLTQQQVESILVQHEQRLGQVENKNRTQDTRLMGVETNIVAFSNKIKQFEDKLNNFQLPDTSEVSKAAAEVANAIAGVEAPEGYKLDKRLDDLRAGVLDNTNRLNQIAYIVEKDVLLPRTYLTPSPVTDTTYQLPVPESGSFIPGPIQVLDALGQNPVVIDGQELTAVISQTGQVVFSQAPRQQVTLHYTMRVDLGKLPEDFLTQVLEMNQVDAEIAAEILTLRQQLTQVSTDLLKERLTPKALYATASGSTVYVSWAYEDLPEISHFILERWDPATGQWMPFDGKQGIVYKS